MAMNYEQLENFISQVAGVIAEKEGLRCSRAYLQRPFTMLEGDDDDWRQVSFDYAAGSFIGLPNRHATICADFKLNELLEMGRKELIDTVSERCKAAADELKKSVSVSPN